MLAAFLKAKGHKVRETLPQGRLVTFGFDNDAAGDAEAYFADAAVSARDLFEAQSVPQSFNSTSKSAPKQHNGA
jgi:hypothetical protein